MADTSVKLSGTYDSIEAYNIMVEMQNMSADYEEIRTEAAAAASAATAAVATANAAVSNATAAANNAGTYADNANTSAGEAAGYASDASTAANNAASSETNASNSASAAATSAANAAASEAVVEGALPLSGGTITGNLSVNGTLKRNNEDVLTSSFTTTTSVTLTGNVSANNWADFSGNITYPAGYIHALCIRSISPPSPANMTLVGWEISDSTIKVRLYSKLAYNGSFTVNVTVTK